MMNNLNKRIITSIILIFTLILMFFFNYILLIGLILISLISWLEFNNLILKIFKKKIYIFMFRVFAFIYLIIFSSIFFNLSTMSAQSKFLLLYFILISIFTDMGGYVFGKFFKGKKLTKISPNKTISGTVGSFIFSILLYYFLVSNDFYLNIIMINLQTNFENLLLLVTIVVSFSSQLGDLFISYIKRLAKMKDTGKILPGYGGLLDRIDGMLFGIPSGLIVINFF